MSEQQLRIGDVEREQAAAALGEHFAQGRLTHDEHGERLDQVWSARTRSDLLPVFSDLPDERNEYVAPARDARSSYWSSGLRPHRGIPAPVFMILALLVVVTVITHLPLILLGGLVWFFVVGRHRLHHHGHGRRLTRG